MLAFSKEDAQIMLSLRRLLFIALVAAVVFAAQGMLLCATAGPKAQTTIYEVHLKSTFGDAGTRKLTLAGENFLWEVSSPGLNLKLIKNSDGLFMLGRTKIAVKYADDDRRRSPMALFPGPIGDVKTFLKSNNAKPAGKEVVNKKKCVIYTYTQSTSGWRCKLWINEATYMPVQIQLNGPKKDDYVKATYVSYKLNTPVPASTFELPKGMRVRSMPDLKSLRKNRDEKQPAK